MTCPIHVKRPSSFAINPLGARCPVLGAGLRYFSVDNLRYRGKNLAIRYDATGAKYGQAGLAVLQDGKVIASAPTMGKLVE